MPPPIARPAFTPAMPAQFSGAATGAAPWLRQGTMPLAASGRVGEFLRTGVMPVTPQHAGFTPAVPQAAPQSAGQPWYSAQLNDSMNTAAAAVAAQKTQQAAIQEQQAQAELIRELDPDLYDIHGRRYRRDSGGD